MLSKDLGKLATCRPVCAASRRGYGEVLQRKRENAPGFKREGGRGSSGRSMSRKRRHR